MRSYAFAFHLTVLLLVGASACEPTETTRSSGEPGRDAAQGAPAADAGTPSAPSGAADASSGDTGGVVAPPADGGLTSSPDAGVVEGDLEVRWIHGAADCGRNQDPALQVHRYDANTFILRQNKCINYEAPFLYLLFGRDKVLLEDTGATSSATLFPLATTVDGVIRELLSERGQDGIDLVVVHSHAHGDHVAGDGQFTGRPRTTVVGTSAANVAAFFGIQRWPTDTAAFDLGGRVIDVVPIPGHQAAHVALYDRNTELLLTGDSLYPGRLYVSDWAAYRDSISRLARFASSRPIRHVLGTHIEMTNRAGIDYPVGTTYQPAEHALALELRHLELLAATLQAIGPTPTRRVLDDFIIDP